MSQSKSKLAPRHMDQSQTPLDRLLHNLHQKQHINDAISLPKLHIQESSASKGSDTLGKVRNSINSNGIQSCPEGQAMIMPSPVVSRPKKKSYKKRNIEKGASRNDIDSVNFHLRAKLVFSPKVNKKKRSKEKDMSNKIVSGVKAPQHDRPVAVSKMLL